MRLARNQLICFKHLLVTKEIHKNSRTLVTFNSPQERGVAFPFENFYKQYVFLSFLFGLLIKTHLSGSSLFVAGSHYVMAAIFLYIRSLTYRVS